MILFKKNLLKSLTISCAGNLLEWYDFGLFSAFSIIFSTIFFPNDDPKIAIIKIFGIYASGFLFRPVGAILFGYLGNRLGRVNTLRLAVFLMSVPTLLIAFIPAYAKIGIWAPCILVFLRMLQGISLGGEFTGAMIYLAEIAPNKARALCVSFIGTFTTLGFLFANAIVLIIERYLTHAQVSQFGWRLGFILGSLLGLSIFYLQRKLPETEISLSLKAKKTNVYKKLFQDSKKKILLVMSLVVFDAVFFYICFVYLRNLLLQLNYSEKFINTTEVLCYSFMLFLVPVGGWMCDRIGRRKSFLIITGSLALLAWPCFKALASGNFIALVTGLAVLVILSSYEQATTSVTVVEQFPAIERYSGVSFSYNLTQTLFGGTAPMVAAWMAYKTSNPISPVFYIIFISIFTFAVSYFYLTETKNCSLK